MLYTSLSFNCTVRRHTVCAQLSSCLVGICQTSS